MSKLTILSPSLFWTTIGSIALVFLGAFESLAVTTIMPTIARELDGESLYSLAFSGTLAASVIGMVVAGRLSDDAGPARPLIIALAVFVAGLAISGTALTMEVFVTGRVLQGLGNGAITVALYVVVGRLYPASLHPKIFGAFAAAWVLPSLIGPPIAGVVADVFSWHWVFLGVGVLVILAAGSVVPALLHLRTMPASEEPREAKSWWSVVWSVVVAVGILAISISGELALWWLAPVAFVIVIIALRPLVPKGTLLAWRGLPATVLLRGLIAASFFAAEIYLPYLLNVTYDLPTWLAGLILTVGAISWAAGSEFQSRMGDRIPHETITRWGSFFLVVGITAQFVTSLLTLSPFVAAAGWLVAGAGMGLLFPRINTLVLGYSTERNQGFNSAAMSITDATGGATAIAFAGLIFLGFGATTGGGFTAALGFTALIALAAVPVAARVRAR
jgi:MFS family permease